jgi:uncharacterized membrane protein (DUF2068 family)
MLFALFSTYGTSWGAVGALLAGTLALPFAAYVWIMDAPYLFSIAAALIAFVAISACTRRVAVSRAV